MIGRKEESGDFFAKHAVMQLSVVKDEGAGNKTATLSVASIILNNKTVIDVKCSITASMILPVFETI